MFQQFPAFWETKEPTAEERHYVRRVLVVSLCFGMTVAIIGFIAHFVATDFGMVH
jgi:hypothetical protein